MADNTTITRAWGIVAQNGTIWVDTMRFTRIGAIAVFVRSWCDYHVDDDHLYVIGTRLPGRDTALDGEQSRLWQKLKRKGYSCRKISISVDIL